ncbi:glycoside hydrolase family 113 [Bradyrhizobium sp. AZCC 1721]|uniref:glycoside hydrolase family 113 n=1 Tax=Bradyrhizobium sp. AZCC 1721 TaxID=3117016 RepID=UPI003FA52F59
MRGWQVFSRFRVLAHCPNGTDSSQAPRPGRHFKGSPRSDRIRSSSSARIWTQTGTSNSVFAEPAKTESDASLLSGFQAAHDAGLSVLFKAALSTLNGTRVSSLAPADVAGFFASYKAEIVHLAAVAQAGGVEMFAIGNEMSSLSGEPYRGYWIDLIAAIREVYHGELTYAAATDEASHVSFWDQLDTIGVNTYPPLTASNAPTVQDLVDAWTAVPVNPYYAAAFDYKSPVDFLHSLATKYDKPLLMTELGYRSINGTAISPGSWTSNGTVDLLEQADAFSAFFQVWTAHGGSWFKGVELWQWDLNNQFSGTGYSVMGKPAEAIVSQYFHGDGAVPDLAMRGSAIADLIDLGRGDDTINAGLGDDIIHGGAGADVIVGGPASSGKLAVTTITLVGYGSAVGGVGAQAQIKLNGEPVSGLMEFNPAADPSEYQTFTISFVDFGPIASIDINLANATPGRALHIKDFLINGVALTPADAANASSPGTFDLYVHNIHVDMTDHQDWLSGAATDNDMIDGGAGNDLITAGVGDDIIDGGEGVDTANFSGNERDYDISIVDGQLVVNDRVAGRDGTDHLTRLEFLQFADGVVDANGLFASPAQSSGSTPKMPATDGNSVSPPLLGGDDRIESVSPDVEGRLLGFLRPFVGGTRERLTFDNHDGLPIGNTDEAGVTLTRTVVSAVLNSASRDPFIFSEMVRHDVARDFKAGESIGDCVVQIDPGHDVSIAFSGGTHLIWDHLLFT